MNRETVNLIIRLLTLGMVAVCLLLVCRTYTRPSSEKAAALAKEKAYADSLKTSNNRIDSLLKQTDSLNFRLAISGAAFEIAVARFEGSRNNTSTIKPKHEAIRSHIIDLPSDSGVLLLSKHLSKKSD